MNRNEIGKISVIVSTYNRNDALHVCIKSLFYQTELPDEVIIGDDGSDERTASTIEKLKKEAPFPIIHLWHEDKFMYNKDRNMQHMKTTNARNEIRCENGISKYLELKE